MARKRVAAAHPTTVQAWIERAAADPEAVSAFAVIRARLAAGAQLAALRRLRIIEVRGALPAADEVRALLHRSSQFYNPHSERCHVRVADGDAAPIEPGEHALLVTERGDERRPGAERWWRHETGAAVEVREGVAWLIRFDLAGAKARAAVESLAVLRDRKTGLLCNPHAQDVAFADGAIPMPWIGAANAGGAG